MKRLFLASSFADVTDLFVRFMAKPYAGKTVTFIPTASLVEEVTFYVDEGKKALEKLNLHVDELEISTAKPLEIEEKLQKNDYIYISGGNTFYLLQELKRTGADKIIQKQINNGKVYIGESAGAIVLSQNIEYASALDDPSAAPSLESFSSLGVVDIYPLPHYTNFPFKEAVDEIIARYKSTLNLCPISNAQVIIVNDDEFQVYSNDHHSD